MFDRFSSPATQVFTMTHTEALRRGHDHVGTEQILLGLLAEGFNLAPTTLEECGLTLESARAQIGQIIGKGQGLNPVEIPFNPRAKRVLDLSLGLPLP